MHINLHPDIKRYVDQEVAAGHFRDADALVNSAVIVLQAEQSDEPSDEHRAYLRSRLDEALASLDRGEGRSWSADQIKQRIRDRIVSPGE
jgi:Arc/MetJ-type ribon-helix-helix transcriptional regulator